MPLLPRRSDQLEDKLHRLEEQMRAMDSRIDEMAETFESRRADDEAAAIAAERIRSGAADHKEDGAEALAKLGIEIPAEELSTKRPGRWASPLPGASSMTLPN